MPPPVAESLMSQVCNKELIRTEPFIGCAKSGVTKAATTCLSIPRATNFRVPVFYVLFLMPIKQF
jgi:hypothetical protein